MLAVNELPLAMHQIVCTRSHGVPLWIEELVETMLELGYLKVIEQEDIIEEDEEEEEECEDVEMRGENPTVNVMTMVPSRELGRKRKVVMKAVTRRRSKSTCELSTGISIGDIPIPDSVTGMVLTRIDHMSPSEQMTLKCAAIVGTSFTRSMLKAIIPNYSPVTFHKSLNTLAEVGIIECAVVAQVRYLYPDLYTRSASQTSIDDPNLKCPCLVKSHQHEQQQHSHHTTHKHGGPLHPPVDECENLQFVHTYVQETAYDLWTEYQKQSLHESAAIYLESQAHKCLNCGGGGFTAGGQKPPVMTKKRRQSTTPATGRALISGGSMRNKLHQRSMTSANYGRRASHIESVDSQVQGSPKDLRRTLSISSLETSNQSHLPTISEARVMGLRYDSICNSAVVGIDLQDCHCNEILVHVYPQLVRHWKAARDTVKTLHYIMEAASAAVATFNNMEALSLLKEADHLLEEEGIEVITETEHARLESLLAQV